MGPNMGPTWAPRGPQNRSKSAFQIDWGSPFFGSDVGKLWKTDVGPILGPSGGLLGPILGPLGAHLGPSWGLWGTFGAILGPLGGQLGSLRALMVAIMVSFAV